MEPDEALYGREAIALFAVGAKAGSYTAHSWLWTAIRAFVFQQARQRLRFADGYTQQLHDDLVQVGYFAMLDAVKAYDPARGFSFLTYMSWPLRNHFNEVLGLRTRRVDPMRYADSLDAPVFDEDGQILSDTIADPNGENGYDEAIHTDYAAFIAQGIIATSSGDIADVMQFMAANGCGLAEASRCLGKDPANMRSKYPAAKTRLKRWAKVRG